MTNEQKLKLDPQALRVLKNLTSALDDVTKALQVSNRQKPKNSELRLTEEAESEKVGSYYPGRVGIEGPTVIVHEDGTVSGLDKDVTYTVV